MFYCKVLKHEWLAMRIIVNKVINNKNNLWNFDIRKDVLKESNI